MLFSSGVVLMLAGLFGGRLAGGAPGVAGFAPAFACAAGAIVVVSTALHFLLPRVPRPVRPTRTMRDQLRLFVESARTFIARPGSGQAIAFILLFKLGTSLMLSMVAPFLLRWVGMTKTQAGFWNGTAGSICTIAGSLIGGLFVARAGLRRGLLLFGVTQDIAIPLYALVAAFHARVAVAGAVTCVEQLAGGLGTAVYANFLMRQCDPEHRAAHYAFATSLMAITSIVGGAISGFIADPLSYAAYFGVASLLAIPSVVLSIVCARRPECAA
jgi:PAT family beta-lactamase induction signal transducer AmpG